MYSWRRGTGEELHTKKIRKLRSTLFDAAGLIYLAFGIPALLVIIVVGTLVALAIVNVRKVRKQQRELAAAKLLFTEQNADGEKDS